MIPNRIIQVREEICRKCPTPCATLPVISNQCSACPLPAPRWGTYGGCLPGEERPFGLGDAVAAVAQPIARAIDAVTMHRTNVAGCGGCKQRREALNRLVPKLPLTS